MQYISSVLKRDFQEIKTSSVNIRLSIFLSILFVFINFLFYVVNNNLNNLSFILIAILFLMLIYLIIFDILFLEIPEKFTNVFIIFALLLNLLFGFTNRFNTIISITDSTVIDNLIGGLIGGAVILAIVVITKEKGMGSGDIKILFLLGLLVGFEKVIIAFFLSIYFALFASIPIIIKNKSYKNIQIPFVPFLVFGAITAFVLGLKLEIFLINYI